MFRKNLYLALCDYQLELFKCIRVTIFDICLIKLDAMQNDKVFGSTISYTGTLRSKSVHRRESGINDATRVPGFADPSVLMSQFVTGLEGKLFRVLRIMMPIWYFRSMYCCRCIPMLLVTLVFL